MDTKIFSSASFMHEYSSEELYVLTTHWLSDIIFFELEIHYFQSLITRYFLPHVKDEHKLLIESLQNQLIKLDSEKSKLRANITAHQEKLSALLNKEEPGSDAYFNAQHTEIEGRLNEFTRNLRQAKKEFFTATKFTGEAKSNT